MLAPEWREDALDFLMRRVWEPDCLWNGLLVGTLDEKQVLKRVDKILENRQELPTREL